MREEPVKLNTFEEFEEKATALWEDWEKKHSSKGRYFLPMLFRGQAMASWNLKTTLERYSPGEYSMEDYFKVMRSIRPEVQSRTGKHWPFPSHYDEIPGASQYAFMVYLRHHGFPSPLLDWTRSFYIAAFFAFQPAKEKEHKDPNVAIYSSIIGSYVSEKNGESIIRDFAPGKNGESIVGVGPYVTTHERHFNQQCEYTFCRKRKNPSSDKKDYAYCNHEDAFENRDDDERSVMTKFIIPKAERDKVLDKLRMMNITAYSLFGSEESLLEDMAYKEIKSE